MAKQIQLGQLVLHHYEITDLIAEGGQASIAKGIDKNTGNYVVIRQLAASPGQSYYDEELARFQRTAQIRIGHPNVVDPIDYGQENDEHYIVMPFIEGMTLEKYVAAHGGKLAVNETVSIISSIAGGLGALQQKGIVHRDIKFDNIIVQPDGHSWILDLGICRDINQQTITKGNGLLGTLLYMSPEHVSNPGCEDHRADLYSLGVMFYFMLTGCYPASGNDTKSIILSICQHIPTSPCQLDTSIPSHIGQACMKLLAKQREQRFQTADDFIAAINGTMPIAAANCFCVSCGAQTQQRFQYCCNCGAMLNVSQSQSALCLACGTQAGETTVCPGCGRAFSRCDHRLLFAAGSLAGTIFRIPEGNFTVGRNELSPRDYHISRKQFYMSCTNGWVYVEDAGSTNKTHVAGQPIDRQTLLLPNSEFRIAGNTATYNHK